MSWLPKRDKLDPVQASEYPPAVRPLAKQVESGIDFVVAQEGVSKFDQSGGGTVVENKNRASKGARF